MMYTLVPGDRSMDAMDHKDESVPQTGSVIIGFSYRGLEEKVVLDHIEIKLFLEELSRFIAGVNEDRSTQWKVMFASFADGLMANGSLFLSSLPGERFWADVYDEMNASELRQLKRKLQTDLDSFPE